MTHERTRQPKNALKGKTLNIRLALEKYADWVSVIEEESFLTYCGKIGFHAEQAPEGRIPDCNSTFPQTEELQRNSELAVIVSKYTVLH